MSYPPPTQDLPSDSDNLRNLALAIRFCSEPDLSHPSKNENHDFFSICKQDICETNRRKRLKSCEDSDLFFDFDIDEESRNGEKTIQHVDEDNDVFSTSQTAVAFGINGVSDIFYFFALRLLNFLLYLLTLPLSKIFCVPPVQA